MKVEIQCEVLKTIEKKGYNISFLTFGETERFGAFEVKVISLIIMNIQFQ